MKFRAQLLFLSAGMCFVLSAPQCNAQSILNQSSDDLLKGFDVDPNQVATQYQYKQVGKAERLLQMLGALMSKSNADTGSGTNSSTNSGTIAGSKNCSKSGDSGTLRVRAPFVKMDVINGERCIRVDAPFLNYDSNPSMSALLRNQESSVAAMPPAPVSPVLPPDLPPYVTPSITPSVTPTVLDASLIAPPSSNELALPTNVLDGSGTTGSGKAGRLRLDRKTALPN